MPACSSFDLRNLREKLADFRQLKKSQSDSTTSLEGVKMFPPRFLRRSAMLLVLPTPPTKSAPFGPSSLFRLSEPFSRCQGKKSHSFFRIFTKLSFRLSAGSGLDMDDWMVGLTQGGAVRLNKMGNPSNGPATKKWLFCINNHLKLQHF